MIEKRRVARRVAHGLVRLYPEPWRVRYQSEFEGLIDDLVDDPSTRWLGLVFGMVRGAIVERIRPSVRADRSAAPDSESYQVFVAMEQARFRRLLLKHRDMLGRRRLPQRVVDELEPGEQVLASFDGIAAGRLARITFTVVVCLTASFMGWVGGMTVAALHAFLVLVLPVEVLFAYAVGCVVSGIVLRACGMTVLITDRDVVTLRVDLLNRPTCVRSRHPFVRPRVVRRGRVYSEVEIGDDRMWVHRRSNYPVAWAGGYPAY
jgi:hypothetical protein